MTSESAPGAVAGKPAVEPPQLQALPPPASEALTPELDAAFHNLQPIDNRGLRLALAVLPWLLVSAGIATLAVADLRAGTVMYVSSLIAVAAALLAFQVLMRLIREMPRSLWERDVISAMTDAASPAGDGSGLASQYARYVRDFGIALNDRLQLPFAAAIGLIAASWVVYDSLKGVSFSTVRMAWELSFAFALGFFVGLLTWRMIITAAQVFKLGRTFELQLQLGHPDRCGGLSPLGNLCLWNALILTVAGIHLGGWLIVAPNLSEPYRDLASTYHDLYLGLLVVPVVFAAVSFFWPMQSVHQEMLADRVRLQRQLDQIGRRINELSRKKLEEADTPGLHDTEELDKEIKAKQATYLENQHLPVWPIDTRILAKFVTSQTVPLLGLTGLGAPLVDTIGSLLSFVDKPS
jgi:hypothetical protein